MKFFEIAVSILISHCAFSQTYVEYQHPKDFVKLPDDLKKDAISDRIKMNTTVGADASYLPSYLDRVASSTEYIHTSGNLFYNIPKIEAYLNSIIEKLKANSSMDNYGFRSFLLHSSDLNAFTNATGHIYITPRMIAECKSEDQLAMIIGHEMAHNIGNDMFEGHVKTMKASRNTGFLLLNQMNRSSALSFSRDQESEADVKGAELMERANYASLTAINIFQAMRHNEEAELLKPDNEGRRSTYNSSHPSTESRITKLKEITSNSSTADPTLDFLLTRNYCRYESIRLLIEECLYEDAIMLGWRFMSEMRDQNVTYLTFDAIRRYLSIFPENKDEKILDIIYNLPDPSNASDPNSAYATSLKTAKENALEHVFMGDNVKEYPAPLNDEHLTFSEFYIELRSRLEAFSNCLECKLQLALATDGEPDDELLIKYLQDSSAQHRDYAAHLLKNEEIDLANKKKLVIPFRMDINEVSKLKLTFGGTYRQLKPLGYFESIRLLGFLGPMTILDEMLVTDYILFDFDNKKYTPDQIQNITSSALLFERLYYNDVDDRDAFRIDPNIYHIVTEFGLSSIDLINVSGYSMQDDRPFISTNLLSTITYRQFNAQKLKFELVSNGAYMMKEEYAGRFNTIRYKHIRKVFRQFYMP